jgi:hypothetical protein
MRSLPKAFRPSPSRSLTSVSFPQFDFYLTILNEVFYLFLWLIIVYITMVVYLLLSKKQVTPVLGISDAIFWARLPYVSNGKPKFFYPLLIGKSLPHFFFAIYFRGFTSTSIGIKDSFLPHLGHFPSYCWRISSGGLRSAPSYSICLHP